MLRDRGGDVGRPPTLGNGGGVSERARGLLYADGDGEPAGELAGDDASGGFRHPATVTDVSSSDVALGSSSLRREETRGGSIWFRPEAPFVADEDPLVARTVEGPAVVAGEDIELEPSPF